MLSIWVFCRFNLETFPWDFQRFQTKIHFCFSRENSGNLQCKRKLACDVWKREKVSRPVTVSMYSEAMAEKLKAQRCTQSLLSFAQLKPITFWVDPMLWLTPWSLAFGHFTKGAAFQPLYPPQAFQAFWLSSILSTSTVWHFVAKKSQILLLYALKQEAAWSVHELPMFPHFGLCRSSDSNLTFTVNPVWRRPLFLVPKWACVCHGVWTCPFLVRTLHHFSSRSQKHFSEQEPDSSSLVQFFPVTT